MTKTTSSTKKENVVKKWHHLDAENRVLGQLATEIVELLMGKHKVDYSPNMNMGDGVVVTNSAKVVLTGNKESGKIYYRHSRKVGNLKSVTAEQLRRIKPNDLIYLAVKGMLPKNKLRKVRLANLKIYKESEHPHKGQVTSS